MKFSFMLLNKTGKARKIPPGESWRWIYYVEDASQLQDVLNHLKREIRDNRLALATWGLSDTPLMRRLQTRLPLPTRAPSFMTTTYTANASSTTLRLTSATVALPMVDVSVAKSSTACSEVLFDGSCPMCSQEIAMYRKLPARQELRWVDVSSPSYRPPQGTNRAMLMQRFHAITPTGELLSGARAFVHVWALLPGWQHLGRAAKLPGVLWALEATYRTFLIFRPWMQTAFRRWSAK